VHNDPSWNVKAVFAFAAVYVAWGSTYLVIRIGSIELPPALFAGFRFLIAAVLLAVMARVAGQRISWTLRAWRQNTVVGICMLATANGLVVWGEQWVPSNQAALLVATAALWIAGFGTLGTKGHKLAPRTIVGLLVGFIGAIVLLLPTHGFSFAHFGGQLGILASALAWSAGSIYTKRNHANTALLAAAAVQSLAAGVFLTSIGLMAGEASRWAWSPTSLWTIGYLGVLGSCVGYFGYIWLVHNVSPAALGTYAYVNPAVAVMLGWFFLDETLDTAQLVGMIVILIGVVLVSRSLLFSYFINRPCVYSLPRRARPVCASLPSDIPQRDRSCG
jgi:drug/metabolite transporter (DMT)-like permease